MRALELALAKDLAQRAPHLFPAEKQRRRPYDPKQVFLGTNDAGNKVWIDERARLEHMQIVGVTGSGKSNFLEHMIVQDIERGRGLVLLDPHGNHPDSIFARVSRWIATTPLANTSRIHIISPNDPDTVVGFNPLAKIPGTSLSVIADALLQAFERAWGDENTQQKPTIRSVLKATFIALAELDLTLCEAKFLFDQTEIGHRVRERALAQLTDEYARDELSRLHETAKSDRSKRDFRAEVVGPINRINEFISSEAIRAMIGQTAADAERPGKTLDMLKIMNRADILLVNLQHGPRVSEADTNLLGSILLRYIFLTAAYRTNREPWMVFVDECHRYLTGDVPSLLQECRKMGLGMHLSHQYMGQLGEPTDLIYQAVRESTRTKAVFAVESAVEAQALAEHLLTLNLEMPVAASVRPVQVGTRIDTLRNVSEAAHRADGVSQSFSSGTSEGEGSSLGQSTSASSSKGSALGKTLGSSVAASRGTSRGQSASTMSSTSSAAGTNSSHGDSVSVSGNPTTQVSPGMTSIPFLQQGGLITTAGFATAPEPWMDGLSLGQSDTSGTSTMSGTAQGTALGTSVADMESASRSESQARSSTLSSSTSLGESESRASSRSRSRSHASAVSTSSMTGRSESQGQSEALFPVYENLPTSFHSKENMVYLAGEDLRRLPKGSAYIRAHGVTFRVAVPLSKIAKV